MDSEVFSGRNQSIDCALAWVTITRGSESEYPFHPVGQFYRVRAGHLWCQACSSLTNLSLRVSSGSYCTSLIVGSRVYSNTCYLIYSLSHCVESEVFSDRDQSICCDVAWVSIARDTESVYPFHPVGQFCKIWAGHLSSPFLKVGRLCNNCFLNHPTVFTDGCE